MQDGGLEVFNGERPRLLALAYRMTGSRADAEDLVQEAWLRWRSRPRSVVDDVPAYLFTVVTRLAVDYLRSARVRRERYVGPWLPEPLVGSSAVAGPAETVEAREQLSMAVMAMMERLTPRQRAVLVLRDGFGYPYEQIAEVIGTSPAACRQLYRRGRSQVKVGRPAAGVDRVAHRKLLEGLLSAITSGDLTGLERQLAAEVVLVADGGGQLPAPRRPVTGRSEVARFLVGLGRLAPADVSLHVLDVNGLPGLIAVSGGSVSHVLTLAGVERVEHIAIVRAPDKLSCVPNPKMSHPEVLSRP